MSEASASNRKYQENLAKFNAILHSSANDENMDADTDINELIVIDDDESSDGDTEPLTVLETTLDSLEGKRKCESELQNVKRVKSEPTDKQNQPNEGKNEDPIIITRYVHPETDDEPEVVEYFLEPAKPNPHTAHSRADDPPPKVKLDIRIITQTIPRSNTNTEFSTLRSLLENPTSTPKRSELIHFKKRMITDNALGTPIDLSVCHSNKNVVQSSSTSQTQSERLPTNVSTQLQPNIVKHSGARGCYQADPQHIVNRPMVNTNVTVQSHELVSQRYTIQAPQRTPERNTVRNRDPRTYARQIANNTPVNVQASHPLQQYHQRNMHSLQNVSSMRSHISGTNPYPHIVQSIMEKQVVVHQFYPQNNIHNQNPRQHYLPPAFQYHPSLQPQRNLPFANLQPGNVSELRYWQNIGKMAHNSMRKPLQTYVQNETCTPNQYQVAPPNQDMQTLKVTSLTIEGIASERMLIENATRTQSVIKNTADLLGQLNTEQNKTDEMKDSPMDEDNAESGLQLLDIPMTILGETADEQNIVIPSDTPMSQNLPSVPMTTPEVNTDEENTNVTDTPTTQDLQNTPTITTEDIADEQNIEVTSATPTTENLLHTSMTTTENTADEQNMNATDIPKTPNLQDPIEEAEDTDHNIQLLRQLHGLFEDLKLSQNSIKKKLEDVSVFDNSDIINKVMKSVQHYWETDTINVGASTSTAFLPPVQRQSDDNNPAVNVDASTSMVSVATDRRRDEHNSAINVGVSTSTTSVATDRRRDDNNPAVTVGASTSTAFVVCVQREKDDNNSAINVGASTSSASVATVQSQRDSNNSAINIGASTSITPVATVQRQTDDFNSDDDYYDPFSEDDGDEDYQSDSDKEPIRKRVRTCTPIELPPEYDATDSRWALRYREPEDVLEELKKDSRVYVNKKRLENCIKIARNTKELLKLLLVEVFSHSALRVCIPRGRKSSLPGLDKLAMEVLLTYVEDQAEKNGWAKESRKSMMSYIRHKLEKIRREAEDL